MRTKTSGILLILCLLLLLVCIRSKAVESAISWKSAKSGRYSHSIEELSETWATGKKKLHGDFKANEIHLSAIPTRNDDTYIGIEAMSFIRAGIEEVVSVLINIKSYVNIYPDLEKIEDILSHDSDHLIRWKFGGPLGTHTIYDTIQRISRIEKNKAVLIYRLSKSDDVLDADGVVVLEEEGGMTKYLSIDFFNAKWGIAGTFFKNKIWNTTCENTGQATLNIKKAAEALKKASALGSEKVVVNCREMENRKEQEAFERLSLNIFD